MNVTDLAPGVKIRFHGGYQQSLEVCPICKYTCGYINDGVLVEPYSTWNPELRKLVPLLDMWTSLLDTGAFAVGSPEQYEWVSAA